MVQPAAHSSGKQTRAKAEEHAHLEELLDYVLPPDVKESTHEQDQAPEETVTGVGKRLRRRSESSSSAGNSESNTELQLLKSKPDGYDSISSSDSDAAPEEPVSHNVRRSSRKRKETTHFTCTKLGNALAPEYLATDPKPRPKKVRFGKADCEVRHGTRGPHGPHEARYGPRKAIHFQAIACYIAAAVSLLCDVGPVDERGPWAPAWAVKKIDHDNPASFKAALKREDKDKWIEAWNLECHNMTRLGVLEQVDWPDDGSNVCGSTLVCKIKRLANGLIDKYRVRWVAQGFSQRWGLDYCCTTTHWLSARSHNPLIII